MARKIRDIKVDPGSEKINLRREPAKTSVDKIKRPKNVLIKHRSPIKKVRDLFNGEEEHYIYIKGKKFTPPKYLGNLLKIAFAGFIILMIINTVNVYYIGKKLEKDISAQAYEGYSYLIDAGKSATKIQFDGAIAAFEKALGNFSDAKDKLWFITGYSSFYDHSDGVGYAVNALLEGGKHFAVAGSYFLEAVEEFNKIPLYFVSKNNPNGNKDLSITEVLSKGLEKTDLAIKEISAAAELISNVNEGALPPEIAARISFAKEKVEEVSTTLNATAQYFPAFLKLLGDRHPHKYMILLQNNNEIRATGGFIGSYAIVDVNQGYITNLKVEDVYDIDGSYGGYIEPPEELKGFTTNWRLRDSNYSPDFAISGAKVKWFLQKEGGPGVDTVIAINQGLLKDLLEITGPVQVGNFGKLNSENYNLLLSYVIEGKIWGAEDPKHILKVFIPAFKEAILQEKNLGKVGSKLYKAIQQKHIMMYSGDSDIQDLFDAFGVSGRMQIPEDNEDYLSVINTSIGGSKSDQFVEENITHDTEIDEHGNITDEVTIKRRHLWSDDIYRSWKKTLAAYGFSEMPDQLIDNLGRGRNKVNMRIYVPAGSVLIDSNAKDIMTKYDDELKKTYFYTVVEIKAGETAKLNVKYRLPFSLDFSEPAGVYKMIVEKQPGSRGSIFNKTIHASDALENIAYYPADGRKDAIGRIIYAGNLVYDRYYSAIWK